MFRSLAAAGVVLVVATPAAAQQSLLWSSTLTAASFEIPVDDGLTIAYVGYVQGKEGRFGRLGDPDFDFRGITHAFRLFAQVSATGFITLQISPPLAEPEHRR